MYYYFLFWMISRFLDNLGVKRHDSILYNHLKEMTKGFYPGLAIIVFLSEGVNLIPHIYKLTLLWANCLISLLIIFLIYKIAQ